jgi:hypothetical protein
MVECVWCEQEAALISAVLNRYRCVVVGTTEGADDMDDDEQSLGNYLAWADGHRQLMGL